MLKWHNERKRMRILHLVPGLSSPANGIAVAARLIASAQEADLADCRAVKDCNLSAYGEVWVHSMWTPQVWRACRAVLKAGRPLVRMTHGCLDPVRVRFHGWKKALVAPVERALFRRTSRVVVTGPWERDWCARWGVKGTFEVVDLKRFFLLPGGPSGRRALPEAVGQARQEGGLHLLFLGRRHPLKGLDLLESAVQTIAQSPNPFPHPIEQSEQSKNPPNPSPHPIEQSEQSEQSNNPNNRTILLRVVSDAFGEEKERVWDWCDVLVLPTLSENFGLVVAEALERGKRVVTTDGAPAWEDQPGVVYLKGFRDGTDAQRVEMLKAVLDRLSRTFPFEARA